MQVAHTRVQSHKPDARKAAKSPAVRDTQTTKSEDDEAEATRVIQVVAHNPIAGKQHLLKGTFEPLVVLPSIKRSSPNG